MQNNIQKTSKAIAPKGTKAILARAYNYEMLADHASDLTLKAYYYTKALAEYNKYLFILTNKLNENMDCLHTSGNTNTKQ